MLGSMRFDGRFFRCESGHGNHPSKNRLPGALCNPEIYGGAHMMAGASANGWLQGWPMLALAVLSNTSASLILKWASLPQHRIESWSAPPALGQIAPLALALLCYGLSFLAYMLALRTFAVSFAYPVITSLSVLLISVAASTVLQEGITPASLLGTVLILLGVGVLMRAA